MDSASETEREPSADDSAEAPDPYRWLEEMGSARTRAWLETQRGLLAGVAQGPGDHRWHELLSGAERSAYGRPVDPPVEAGGLVFRREHQPGGDLLVGQDDTPDGRRVLLDCREAEFGRIAHWGVSPEGGFAAVQVHYDGREDGGLQLLSTRPGTRPEHLPHAAPHTPLAFVGRWLLYGAGSRTEHTLLARNLATGTQHTVRLPVRGPVRLSLHAGTGDWLLVRTRTPGESVTRWWFARWRGPAVPDWKPLDLAGSRVTALELADDTCYLADGDIRAIDLTALDDGPRAVPRTVVPAPADGGPAPVRALRVLRTASGTGIVALRQRGTVRTLTVHRLKAGSPFPSDDRGAVVTWPARLRLGPVARDRAGRAGDGLWLLADDPRYGTHASRLALGEPLPARLRRSPLRTITVVSRDGTPVPVTLCDPGTAAPRGPRPTLVTVYGGFGIPLEPGWDPMIAAWLQAGGRVAWVHARGGGEYGPAWAEAGRAAGKARVVEDLCAAADALVERAETGPARPAVLAASNGGLIAAAALVQAPGLFSAGVCAAPLTDLLRYQEGGLGRLWQDEYGDPDDPGMRRALRDLSPYQRVVDADSPVAGPPVLFVTGGNDARVPAWHGWKLCAALQRHRAGSAPIHLDHDENSGHSGRSDTAAHTSGVRTLAFLSTATGLEHAQATVAV
ncbi:prolyl oligopeptidase family serine peptidase [Streptomyces sp. NBC_00878]|uniref:prolyl oligopeptidase family serine peptidase n=1 Tax=Streptomyces sp. NBC_00878 TaxID=2975854 RepID=UPI002256817C|nr:prolyl oligopeptidase family serine peptidase [Streptomyces sp. NBC_00878]MCX4910614.1 prolyl oligopeptidase family serine peptidase [Streptomyces sp. NBC_00878]